MIYKIFTRIILEESPELKRDLESHIKEMDLKDHLIHSQASARSGHGTCYASAAYFDQLQELY